MNSEQFIINEPLNFDFQVNRRALVDPLVLQKEMENIFEKCWIYVGHESEVKDI